MKSDVKEEDMARVVLDQALREKLNDLNQVLE
jgi:hypothetical protein